MSAPAKPAAKPRTRIDHGPADAEAAHAAMAADDELWPSLRFDGLQGTGFGGIYENRRCPSCTSTIMREISVVAAALVLEEQAKRLSGSLEALASTQVELTTPRPAKNGLPCA